MRNLSYNIWVRFSAAVAVIILFSAIGLGHITCFAHTKEESIYLSGNWEKDENGWRFFNQYDLIYPSGKWAEYKGDSYYFMDNGYMATGWYYLNNYWYYFNPSKGKKEGAMVIGWIYEPSYDGWFYTNQKGIMVTGWHKIYGSWYYFNSNPEGTLGLMAANCVIDDSYIDSNGRMNETP